MKPRSSVNRDLTLVGSTDEAQETIRALRHGEVDALVVTESAGEEIFTITRGRHASEIEDIISAIQNGEVDALVVCQSTGDKVFTLHAAQEALRETTDQFRFALDAADLVAWEWDPANDRFNQLGIGHTFERMLSDDSVTGKEFLAAIHPEERENVESSLRAALENRSTFEAEFRVVDSSGQTRWFFARGRAKVDKSGNVVNINGVYLNITKRKLQEQELHDYQTHLEALVEERTRQLQQSHERMRLTDRMATLGMLSAGVGHDLSNLLLPLRVRLQSIESKPMPPEFQDDFRAIRLSAEYLAKLARGLGAFSLDPQSGDQMEATPLEEWWDEVQPFFKNVISRPTQLKSEFASPLPPVRMNRSALTQAVLNLVQNAGEALHDRKDGCITVGAKVDAERSVVLLSIRDNGPGMSDDVLSHCFEPFFSTKKRDIPTGLGLALVHGIVERVGGSIHIQSQPGYGTEFILTLPQHKG